MPLSAKQEIALSFLKKHIEFFAAPLWNQVLFTQWAKNQAILVEFSAVLRSAIDNLLHYKNALIGAGNLDRHHSLLYGKEERTRHLLVNNEPLVEVLAQLSHDTEVIALWDSWYATNPDIVPQRRALGDNFLAEKLQRLEQKEQARAQKPAQLERLATSSKIESTAASSSTTATSSAVAKDKNQNKLAAPGLKKICRRLDRLNTDMEVFFDITLVFENQKIALEFQKNLEQKSAAEQINSLKLHDFGSFNKDLFPTEFMFQVKAVPNSDLEHEILDHENMAGGILLTELEQRVNISNIPQIDTDYHCIGRIPRVTRTYSSHDEDHTQTAEKKSIITDSTTSVLSRPRGLVRSKSIFFNQQEAAKLQKNTDEAKPGLLSFNLDLR